MRLLHEFCERMDVEPLDNFDVWSFYNLLIDRLPLWKEL